MILPARTRVKSRPKYQYDGVRRMAKLLREFDKAGIETELFEEGLLDSFGLVELLVRLEQFGKTLDVAELTREEISTPAKIAALLA